MSVGHLRINCRRLFVLTLVGPNKSLNLFIFSATARAGGRREVDEASRYAGQRRHHPPAFEAPGRASGPKTKTVRVAGVTTGAGERVAAYGTIIVPTWSSTRLSMCCRIGQPRRLGLRPQVEIVSRDRCGLYAQGAREGAPQARRVADRFHLLQNLRETIETQLSRADRSTGGALLPESRDDVVTIWGGSGWAQAKSQKNRRLTRQAHRRSRQAVFDQIHILREAGASIGDIARGTGFSPRSIRK